MLDPAIMEKSEQTSRDPVAKLPAPESLKTLPTRNLSVTTNKNPKVTTDTTEIHPSIRPEGKDQIVPAPKDTSDSPNRPQIPTAPSRPPPPRKWMIHEKQLDEYGNVRQGFDRKFPPPTDNMTIEERLALPALPWSPLYRDEAPRKNVHYEKSAEQKTREFEQTKEELRGVARNSKT
jgi:hypothetical protein